jgi:hypothetical protein
VLAPRIDADNAVAAAARRGARPRPAGEPRGPAPRLMPWPRRAARCRPGARRTAAVAIGGLRWALPAGQGPRPRSAGESAGPAPRSTPRPRRGVRCRPRAAPVVRCVKFTPDCRRDLRRIVANIEGAAVLTCGRCPPVSGSARRRPASLQWANSCRPAAPMRGTV